MAVKKFPLNLEPWTAEDKLIEYEEPRRKIGPGEARAARHYGCLHTPGRAHDYQLSPTILGEHKSYDGGFNVEGLGKEIAADICNELAMACKLAIRHRLPEKLARELRQARSLFNKGECSRGMMDGGTHANKIPLRMLIFEAERHLPNKVAAVIHEHYFEAERVWRNETLLTLAYPDISWVSISTRTGVTRVFRGDLDPTFMFERVTNGSLRYVIRPLEIKYPLPVPWSVGWSPCVGRVRGPSTT